MMPSNKAKQNWNAAHYTQIKVSVQPEIAEKFKTACAQAGISMATALSGFMAEYSKIAQPCVQTKKDMVSTRKDRRFAIKSISDQMEELLAAEECYYENVPQNLQGSRWHEASGESIAVFHEVLGLLSDIY